MIELLLQDHREVERLFVELETGVGSPEHRRDLADAVTAELIRHAVTEEEYLYPTARRALPDGDQVAEHEIAEHAEAEQTLKDWEGISADDPRFDVLYRKVTSEIRHHIQDEESNLFPRLRAACSEEELADLGRRMEIAKLVAPTRPHPNAPDRPPWNKILAPGTGFVDRVRDALSHRKTSSEALRGK
ncbi:MAG TPA: hemerythrin domain-containing protein [Micromonosporaceae bacterium]